MDIDIENCSFGSDHFEEFLNPSLEDDSNPNNLVLNPLVEKAIYWVEIKITKSQSHIFT